MLATKGLPAGSKLVMKTRLDFFVFKSCFLFSFRGRIWVQVGWGFFGGEGGGEEGGDESEIKGMSAFPDQVEFC